MKAPKGVGPSSPSNRHLDEGRDQQGFHSQQNCFRVQSSDIRQISWLLFWRRKKERSARLKEYYQARLDLQIMGRSRCESMEESELIGRTSPAHHIAQQPRDLTSITDEVMEIRSRAPASRITTGPIV